ncbi:MAG: chemotaxis protein CheD [Pontiellaceae bacterium]|nr:chemotaxis protein CheD [Pontiellaceae bacterium]MBN2785806.1 chemotaxis protein CheD [Pontiellaceae bacterium]
MPKIIVGVSDAKVSNSPTDIVATYSLGSCVGVCLYEPRLKIGGMLHFQLPESKIDAVKAKNRPDMFADTGLTHLLEMMQAKGARRAGLTVKIAGGASMQNGPNSFEIGKRNCIAIRKALWKVGLMIKAADVEGSIARTLFMDVSTGIITVKSPGNVKEL